MGKFSKVLLITALSSIVLGAIIIAAVGIVTQGEFIGNAYTDYVEYQPNEVFDSLNIDISYGEIRIVKGDSFKVTADKIYGEGFSCLIEDGTFYVKQELPKNKLIPVMGWKLPAGFFGISDITNSRIVIEIPNNFAFYNIDVSLGAGVMYVEDLNAENAIVQTGVGEVVIDNLICNQKAACQISIGKMEIDYIEANETKLDCGIGYAKVNGVLSGYNEIDCGIGYFEADINGGISEYGYKLDCKIGDNRVNGREYGGIGSSMFKRKSETTDNYYDMSCGIGYLKLDVN